jgi:glycogen synthase
VRIEVDQSGKVEQTNMDTVIAFSNGKAASLRITAKVKRDLVTAMRAEGYRGTAFYLRIFCAALSTLIKPYLGEIETVAIDEEYDGRDRQIKDLLVSYINSGWDGEIYVTNITKKSPAHKLALGTLRGESRANQRISFEELWEVISKKKKSG